MVSAKDWQGEVQKLGGHSFEGLCVLACHGGLSADGVSFLYELRMGLWQVLSIGVKNLLRSAMWLIGSGVSYRALHGARSTQLMLKAVVRRVA